MGFDVNLGGSITWRDKIHFVMPLDGWLIDFSSFISSKHNLWPNSLF